METRQRIRREIAALVDVDPIERRRALESFAVSLRQGAVQQSAPNSSCLGFLSELSDDGLLGLLRDEHPQTKAVVLAEIPPARAASLLPRLGAEQRQDLLARIGRLPDVPEEMLSELARSFRSRMDRLTAEHQHRLSRNFGRRDRSDEAYDLMASSESLAGSTTAVSPRLQAILAEMPATSSTSHPTSSNAAPFESTADRLRRTTREPTEPTASHATSLSTERTHRELMQLPPDKLCESLGRVDTRTAILALCGLPSNVADAAIACLPRSQANQVRQHLMSVGRMEIREIDQAKAAVAVAARVAGQSSHDSGPASAGTPARAAAAPSHGHIAVAM